MAARKADAAGPVGGLRPLHRLRGVQGRPGARGDDAHGTFLEEGSSGGNVAPRANRGAGRTADRPTSAAEGVGHGPPPETARPIRR